MEVEPASKTQY